MKGPSNQTPLVVEELLGPGEALGACEGVAHGPLGRSSRSSESFHPRRSAKKRWKLSASLAA